MKLHTKRYSIILVIIVVFSGCNKKVTPPPSELDKRMELLKNQGNSWIIGSTGYVSKDDYDVTNQFENFKLTFGNKMYTTESSLMHVWATSGSWGFMDNDPDIIIRDDGAVISIAITDNSLDLMFTSNGVSSGGRSSGIQGNYSFHLEKE